MKLRQLKGIRPSKKVMIIALVAVLAVAGVLAWYQFGSKRTSNQDAPQPTKEEQSLTKSLDAAKDDKAKVAALNDLSNYYANSDDKSEKQKAVEYADQAAKLQRDASSYGILGSTYESAGNIEAAIAAYEKAASLSEKTSLDDSRSDYAYYTGQAERLKGSQ